jgi:hypothetical protein
MATTDRRGNTLLQSGLFAPCSAATTGANIALSGQQTIDGVALNAGDRVLVKDQSDETTNGIYAVATGNWTRTSDANSNAQFFQGMAVLIALGTVNAGSLFMCTCADDPVIVGTSLLTFALQSALQQALFQATSTTALLIGAGNKAFTIQTGKNFAANQWVLAYSQSNTSNVLFGQVVSYAAGILTVNVTATGGSGTPNDWVIVLSNSPAAQGLQPPVGTGNMTGNGSSVSGNFPIYTDASGKNVADSGKAPGTLATRNQLIYGDAGTATIPAVALAPDVMRGPLVGQPGVGENFLLSNDGTNPTRDIDIGPGRVEDDTFTSKLRLKGMMVKRLDTAWAAGGVTGSPAGGCDAGGVKGTGQTLHAYVIGAMGLSVTQFSRTGNVATLTITGHPLGAGGTIEPQGIGSGFDVGAVITAVTTNTVSFANTGANVGTTACAAIANGFDVLFSRQDVHAYPGPVMPTGFTLKQCLGSVLTDGSANIRPFTQVGDLFFLGTPIGEIVNTAPGDANAHTLTLTGVPIGVALLAMMQACLASTGGLGYLSPLIVPDVAPLGTTSPAYNYGSLQGAGSAAGGVLHILTNSSGQVRYRLSASNPQTIVTLGWRDPRRRLF